MVTIRRLAFMLIVMVFMVACSLPGQAPTYPVLPTFPVPPESLASPVGSMPPEFGKASWTVDPSFAAPDANAVELHLLVWELACSGGAPATGRISPPVIIYGPTTVTVALGVRPIEVPPGFAVTCPGPPGTPAVLELAEPLRPRHLLDGGCAPAVVRASPGLLEPGCLEQ